MHIIDNYIKLSTVIENEQSLEKLTRKKKQAVKLNLQRKFQLIGLTKISERCGECGNFLTFDHQVHITSHDERLKLIKANFCKNKFCPTCSKLNSLKVAMIVKQILDTLGDKYQVIFVTFTIKNPPITRLHSSIELLNTSFRRLSNRKFWKDSIKGFFRAIEYLGDNTQAGQAHPHIHSILLVENDYFDKSSNKYIKKDVWIEEWRKALRVNYDPSIYIESIYDKMKAHQEIDANTADAFEVAKYCTTFSDLNKLSDKDFGYLYRATRGTRLYAFGGVFKDCKSQAIIDLAREKANEDRQWDTLERLVYTWLEGQYHLREDKPEQPLDQ